MSKVRGLARFCLIVSVTLMIRALIPIAASATSLTITQLTNNSSFDHGPQISGSNVFWLGYDGHDDEIFYYNGSSTIQLTNNNFDHDDHGYHAEGNHAVWYSWDGHDDEIFLYDGSKTKRLTYNGYDDKMPRISGNNVVWAGYDGHDYEIFLYDGSSTVQLTNNSYDDIGPQISGSNVVWQSYDGNDHEIFFYNGSKTKRLTYNGHTDELPKISGNNVVWQSYDGNDYEIFFYNGSSTAQLTDNNFGDHHPKISGKNVVWEADYGSASWEIFFYDGSKTVRLTNNDYLDWDPQVSGNNVVWVSSGEIFYYNGSSTVQLKNNGRNAWGPRVSGNNVVWRSSDGNDSEIFMAKLPRPSVSLWAPDVSTKHSKRPQFTVRWKGLGSQKGIDKYTVRVRRDDRRTWHTLLSDTTATSTLFKGKMGHTYNFRVNTKDSEGNTKWSMVKKTIVPYNEGANVYKRLGFNGYFKGSKSSYYLSSTRYSYKRGHSVAYKIPNAKSIGLITTKGPKRGKANIYIDGQLVKTVDASSSKNRPRQLIYEKTFKKKKTHYIRIENLGTPGRSRFDIDGIAVGK